MCEGESTREEERAGPGGFQRRLVGAGGPAADLETWVGLQSQRGRSACPNLGQENWCCRNKDQSATAQSPVLANLKIPALSIFFFPSWSLFFSPSFLFSSFSDDRSSLIFSGILTYIQRSNLVQFCTPLQVHRPILPSNTHSMSSVKYCMSLNSSLNLLSLTVA